MPASRHPEAAEVGGRARRRLSQSQAWRWLLTLIRCCVHTRDRVQRILKGGATAWARGLNLEVRMDWGGTTFCSRRFAAAVLAAAGLAAFSAGAAEAEKKIIRSVPIGSLKILDPIWTTAYITRNHAYMVWDTLFALDANNVPQPQMVDTWTVSDDKLTYTFKLRDGLK